MKFVMQFGIIAGITFMGEILSKIVPFPVPSSIWGMGILFTALITNLIKLEEIQDSADFLLAIMSIMYVPIGAELIVQYAGIKNELIPIVVISFVSTLLCFFVTGHVAQIILKHDKKQEENKNA